jgi:hypothetical protein
MKANALNQVTFKITPHDFAQKASLDNWKDTSAPLPLLAKARLVTAPPAPPPQFRRPCQFVFGQCPLVSQVFVRCFVRYHTYLLTVASYFQNNFINNEPFAIRVSFMGITTTILNMGK